MPWAAREEVRVVKRVLLARRGRFLLAFLDGGPSAIFRVKHRDASTSSARSLARSRCKRRKVRRPRDFRFRVRVQRPRLTFCAHVDIGFSPVSPAARNPSPRFANAIVGDRLSTGDRRSRDKRLIRSRCFYDMRTSRRLICLLVYRDIRVNCKNSSFLHNC